LEILDLLHPPKIEKCYICGTEFDINTEFCPYCEWIYLGNEEKLDENEKEPINGISLVEAWESLERGLTMTGVPLPEKRLIEKVRYIGSKHENFLIENNRIDLEPNKIYTVVERVKNRWIRVVDESEVESVDLNEQPESNRDEYIAGYNDGHIEGYKEGFREGFNDGYTSKCGICQRNASYNE
jgi:hypothetical protein